MLLMCMSKERFLNSSAYWYLLWFIISKLICPHLGSLLQETTASIPPYPQNAYLTSCCQNLRDQMGFVKWLRPGRLRQGALIQQVTAGVPLQVSVLLRSAWYRNRERLLSLAWTMAVSNWLQPGHKAGLLSEPVHTSVHTVTRAGADKWLQNGY